MCGATNTVAALNVRVQTADVGKLAFFMILQPGG
jgi:hypothetical protein